MATIAEEETSIAKWRLNGLRLIYLLMAVGISSFVWQQLFFESADWPLMKGIAKSMFAALAILSVIGLRYPLQMLPVILFETLWKLIWLVGIAFPATLNGRWELVETTFYECITIIVVFFVMPWSFLWSRYFRKVQ